MSILPRGQQHRGGCGIYKPSGYADCRCTCGALPTDPVRAALEELVSCHFSVIEHPDPEEEARRSHARMAAAWRQALIALGKWPRTSEELEQA